MKDLLDTHALPQPYWYAPQAMLYRGDCEELLPMLKTAVDAVITDPPYGMAWNAKSKMGRPSSVATAGGTYGRDWGYIEGDRKPFDPAPLLATGKPLVT
jgi:DNA modification methylase